MIIKKKFCPARKYIYLRAGVQRTKKHYIRLRRDRLQAHQVSLNTEDFGTNQKQRKKEIESLRNKKGKTIDGQRRQTNIAKQEPFPEFQS